MTGLENLSSFKFKEQRRQLIESLHRRPELSTDVINAMSVLPREIFVPKAFINRAYEDSALPIDNNQTISQPYTVAYQTTLLKIKQGDKVLEIGTGSGYQASVLFLLGARVYTVERITELYEQARELFTKLDLKIKTRLGDGTIGWNEYAPYDSIIVTAAAPDVPSSLIEQLSIGGKLVIPVGDKYSQEMYCIEKISNEESNIHKSDRFKFVPLIGKEGWANGD